MKRRSRYTRGWLLAAGLLAGAPAGAQWTRVYDQFYMPASHNWVFRNSYRFADRLFNAFDYGHAILYEKLWTVPGNVRELEEKQFDYLTQKLLINPPRLPLEEMAIEPNYARLAPEAKTMFEWAHILHRQAYDILADERLSQDAKDREMQRILDYYRSRRDLTFSEYPKNMSLMQEQPYSLAFRQQYPKFNGLIWAYHWLQVGLYEPLVVRQDAAAREEGLRATVTRFRQLIAGGAASMPYVMPMTAAIAPEFAKRYPEFAIIFDNLHSMHDVISDILANPVVTRDQKRTQILLAASRYRDDTTDIMTVEGWCRMAIGMGIENQGGPSVGFTKELLKPTVERGAVMRHDKDGKMLGEHAGHDMHAGHNMPDPAAWCGQVKVR